MSLHLFFSDFHSISGYRIVLTPSAFPITHPSISPLHSCFQKYYKGSNTTTAASKTLELGFHWWFLPQDPETVCSHPLSLADFILKLWSPQSSLLCFLVMILNNFITFRQSSHIFIIQDISTLVLVRHLDIYPFHWHYWYRYTFSCPEATSSILQVSVLDCEARCWVISFRFVVSCLSCIWTYSFQVSWWSVCLLVNKLNLFSLHSFCHIFLVLSSIHLISFVACSHYSPLWSTTFLHTSSMILTFLFWIYTQFHLVAVPS